MELKNLVTENADKLSDEAIVMIHKIAVLNGAGPVCLMAAYELLR